MNRPNFDFSTRAFAREFHADADLRLHAETLRVFDDQSEFRKIFDDRDDSPTEFGGEHCGLDVAVVFEAVADDQSIRRVFTHRHHGEQFGFAASLESEAEFGAVAVDLFDDEALLVHLDRINGGVSIAVVVLGHRPRKGVVQLAQAMRQNSGETHHDGRREFALFEALYHFEKIDLAIGALLGTDHDVALFVDAEVALSPGLHVVELA
jgi:hypothetical protein